MKTKKAMGINRNALDPMAPTQKIPLIAISGLDGDGLDNAA